MIRIIRRIQGVFSRPKVRFSAKEIVQLHLWPLCATLSLNTQGDAVESVGPASGRKLLVATNIVEMSVRLTSVAIIYELPSVGGTEEFVGENHPVPNHQSSISISEGPSDAGESSLSMNTTNGGSIFSAFVRSRSKSRTFGISLSAFASSKLTKLRLDSVPAGQVACKKS